MDPLGYILRISVRSYGGRSEDLKDWFVQLH